MQNHTQTQAHGIHKGRSERAPNRLDNSFSGWMGLACQNPDQTTDDPGGRIVETMPTWFLRIANILKGHHRTWVLECAKGVTLERRWCHLGLPEDGSSLQKPPATGRQRELNNRWQEVSKPPNSLDNSFCGGMGLACQCLTRPQMTQVPTRREPVPTWVLRIANILGTNAGLGLRTVRESQSLTDAICLPGSQEDKPMAGARRHMRGTNTNCCGHQARSHPTSNTPRTGRKRGRENEEAEDSCRIAT